MSHIHPGTGPAPCCHVTMVVREWGIKRPMPASGHGRCSAVGTNSMALCSVCKEMMSVFQDYNLKRHNMQKHAAQFYAFQGMLCKDEIEKLKSVTSTKCYQKNPKAQKNSVTKSNCMVANLIAKKIKPIYWWRVYWAVTGMHGWYYVSWLKK